MTSSIDRSSIINQTLPRSNAIPYRHIHDPNEQFSGVVQTRLSADFILFFFKTGNEKKTHDFGKFRKPQLMTKNTK